MRPVPGPGAGAGAGQDPVGGGQQMPRVAQQRGPDRRTAVTVLESGRRPSWPGEVPVAPSCERHHDRAQVKAGAGEAVLVPSPAAGLAVGDALGQAGFGQPGQPAGEHVAGDAEVVGEVIEATDAIEQVPQHKQRPRLADQLQRPCQGACPAVKLCPSHAYTIAGLLNKTQIPPSPRLCLLERIRRGG
jgi:hypothetical protein